MPVLMRAERTALRFSGPEATKLLNDVITGVVAAEPGIARWWALLSPQGKMQAEGLIGWAEDAFWLDVHTSVAESFLRRMKMYRLRAKAEIELLAESHRVGWLAALEDESGTGIRHRDSRVEGMGHRVIAPISETADWSSDPEPFEATRIAAGLAELGADFPPDAAFAHDIGMDLLGGIDFSKGCYVGQEVVSRMKHRGTARRRPLIATGIAAKTGSPVKAGGREAGTLGRVIGGEAVAIVRLDRLENASAGTAAGHPIALRLPSWASYRFGESGPSE